MEEAKITKQKILMSCAPVLFHLKAGGTVFLKAGDTKEFLAVMAEWNVCFKLLYHEEMGSLFFIFQERLLEEQLSKKENSTILKQVGYERTEREYCLLRLCQRYRDYREREGGFPHELGVFLGYPPEDVLGFISHNGKDSLLNGYWKVYTRPQEAKRQFYYFDRAKEEAAGFFHDLKNRERH